MAVKFFKEQKFQSILYVLAKNGVTHLKGPVKRKDYPNARKKELFLFIISVNNLLAIAEIGKLGAGLES
jgi:hypothetical protein